MNINWLSEMRPDRGHRSVKSTDSPGATLPGTTCRGYSRRGICAAVVAAAALLIGSLPGHAQGTDQERRQLEIEGKQLQQQKQQQRKDQAKEKAKAGRQIQQFEHGERSRENWINQLEQRNKQQYENIDRPH